MKTRELNKKLKYTPKNTIELMESLLKGVENGNTGYLALAYLVNELCPDDRTSKHVFRMLKDE